MISLTPRIALEEPVPQPPPRGAAQKVEDRQSRSNGSEN